ncbi:hypothetical protein AB0L63_17525 [Nocardia sp. NPDC051990]|uniref:hypothetical protein n=1 Tax=Nocardia sp. NPDC051990 TaxID=3155285 RepID=UPI003420877B
MHGAFGVAGLVLAVIVVDRVAVWAERRGWIYWRHRPKTAGVGSGVLGQVESLLSPSYRHVVEESQSKQTLRIDQAIGETDAAVVVVLRGDREDAR